MDTETETQLIEIKISLEERAEKVRKCWEGHLDKSTDVYTLEADKLMSAIEARCEDGYDSLELPATNLTPQEIRLVLPLGIKLITCDDTNTIIWGMKLYKYICDTCAAMFALYPLYSYNRPEDDTGYRLLHAQLSKAEMTNSELVRNGYSRKYTQEYIEQHKDAAAKRLEELKIEAERNDDDSATTEEPEPPREEPNHSFWGGIFN